MFSRLTGRLGRSLASCCTLPRAEGARDLSPPRGSEVFASRNERYEARQFESGPGEARSGGTRPGEASRLFRRADRAESSGAGRAGRARRSQAGRDSGAQWGAQELGGQALAVVKREAGVGRPQPSGRAGQSQTGQDERSGPGRSRAGRNSGAQRGAHELGGQALVMVEREAGGGRPQPSWRGGVMSRRVLGD